VSTLPLSLFQESVLLVPEQYDLFLGGGRGGAKSWTLALLAWRHCEQYGQLARVLYLRQSYKGLADFELVCRELFTSVYGTQARYNAHEKVWRFPNHGYLELGQLEGPGDYSKYQGRSFTLVSVDEAGQYANPMLLDKLRSNLRGPAALPLRVCLAANPGDLGHHWLASRYALRGEPWHPFDEHTSQREWVSCPSTYRDNPFIDQEAYRQQLAAACAGDPELLEAWLSGNWAIARGAFFAGALDEGRNLVEPWDRLPVPWTRRGEWRYFISMDYGFDAPSVVYLVAKSPGDYLPDGRYAPKGSLILFDELATNVPGELNTGLRWPIEKQAEAIKALCAPWKVPPTGCADDACFAEAGSVGGSYARQFGHYGVLLSRAGKGLRAPGWMLMRQLLVDAGKPDKPGLYISRNCEYFWSSVPHLSRDPRIPNDCDSRGPDHGADACRYACVYEPATIRAIHLSGL
jgi:hypothetical protein